MINTLNTDNRPSAYIPLQDIKCHYSSLTDYLDAVTGYDPQRMKDIDNIISRYHLGATCTTEHDHFGTVLPRINRDGKVVGGSVIYFDACRGDALRVEKLTDNLAHRICSRYYEAPDVFFGEHLISYRPLAIVQEEKTALLATLARYPLDWLAVGVGRNLTLAMLEKLKGRQVILFADDMSYDFWQHKFGDSYMVSDSYIGQDINEYLVKRIAGMFKADIYHKI